MKIILSRKGFDSSYGGGASPIMPNNDLISIPIPANTKEKGIPYTDIYYDGKSYLNWMQMLGLKIPKQPLCHFDPDIYKNAVKRNDAWQGAFGQHGAALTHLKNCQVEVGDIFLFFGSFKRTYQEGKTLKFEKDYERHIIFGYLKIGEILNPDFCPVPIAYKNHPHVQNNEQYQPRNLIYLARSSSDFGAFKYHERLVLTRNGFPKSQWKLPEFFHPRFGTSISRHSERDFRIQNSKTLMRSRGIGQDFVITGNPEVEEWALDIIKQSERVN